ncbi:ATP-dependent helicase C-terminal domain-containing protein [Reinekea sp.]|jgi:ATP-dependent helicase HrpB|uniref:ATP-dependent helicase C-terminal domain-containing protein n=1 Tax=Reinekea sp. TaxID=1970455 RepID=UPI00398918E5
MPASLPIDSIKTDVLTAWQRGGCIVAAPPGSGKSTQLPLWGLSLANEKIYLLIPKRIAVKLAAQRLASNLGEPVGQTVGYQLRHDRKTSQQSRIIVTTYGSFLQMLLNNPDSITNSTVIMDEFHERGLDQDISFALIQEAIELLDESVTQIIMSATLEINQLLALTKLPLISSPGFSHPIDIQYKKLAIQRSDLFAEEIKKQWQGSNSHILVFLPGLKEIRALERNLNSTIPVLVLHGQQRDTPNLTVLEHAPATVILATNIAESSITLANVHTVIDSGMERYASTHPISGLQTLKSRRISQASATQRAGRAGRLAPGTAIRLWSEEEHKSLIPYQPAEITQTDLTLALLQLTLWGTSFDQAVWLTKPDANRVAAAQVKCEQWGAIIKGQLSIHGAEMLKTGLEPGLAHFVVLSKQHKCLEAAICFAATLSIAPELLEDAFTRTTLPNHPEIQKEAKRLAKRLEVALAKQFTPIRAGTLIQAFRHRLIYAPKQQTAKMLDGAAVTLAQPSSSEWSLMLDGHRNEQGIRVFNALALNQASVLNALEVEQKVTFKPEQKQEFWLVEELGTLVLSEKPIQPDHQQKKQAWLGYIQQVGSAAIPNNPDIKALENRWRIAKQQHTDWPQWPAKDDWLDIASPFLDSLTKLAQLDSYTALKNWLGYSQLSLLDQLCPKNWTCPSGRAVELDYQPAQHKVTASLKLQEAFGLANQPLVANTQFVTLDLTAPNGRPVASVSDIKYFWHEIYPQVRKELRGRYAKHPWPEDPLNFKATAKTNRQLRAT